ncbi:MAG: Zn-ribbon domain-containing OB-fold protein [Candidatus Promineifilaceae bacterium]|nr:Zn-ribbon domain-containing OB-fold protein [Candidatus Promineifilaceae bacterium]
MTHRPFTEKSYQQFLSEEILAASRCLDTGEIFLPPRPMCPKTFSTHMEWVELSGSGTLEAFTVVLIGPTAMISAGYDRHNPYCSGIVRLKEGPAISAQILDLETSRPESIEIGTPLQATFIKRNGNENGRTFLAFYKIVE